MLDRYGISQSGIRSKGRVTDSSVLIGGNFVCDGHFGRPVRVVTHAHSDHIKGLNKSLEKCEAVLMTPKTKELLRALYRNRFEKMKDVITLDYGETFLYGEEKLTFYDANHIPGSAQTLVETEKGERILYTGDIKLPGAPIISADLLIIEATYGKPSQCRYFQNRINGIFTEFVKQKIEDNSIIVRGYHGKLQEILKILRRRNVWNPAVMTSRIFEATKVCEEGDEFGKFYCMDNEEWKNTEIENYIGLCHIMEKIEFDNPGIEVRLSGWIFDEPIRRKNGHYIIGLSGHCDFNRLMKYVSFCDPDYVITDGSNGGTPKALAREIRKKLRKPAVAMS